MIVIGTTNRTECIFEVLERIGDWFIHVPGTLYVIERTTEVKDRGIKLRPPKDGEISRIASFVVTECKMPDSELLWLYHSKPNI